MSASDVIVDILEPILKDRKQAIRVGNEIATALDIGGWLTTDSDNLAMLRAVKQRLYTQVMDADCPARDLASLSRNLQKIGEEVATLEARQSQERRERGDSNSNGKPTDREFDPGSV